MTLTRAALGRLAATTRHREREQAALHERPLHDGIAPQVILARGELEDVRHVRPTEPLQVELAGEPAVPVDAGGGDGADVPASLSVGLLTRGIYRELMRVAVGGGSFAFSRRHVTTDYCLCGVATSPPYR
jgi:hypothetical protein